MQPKKSFAGSVEQSGVGGEYTSNLTLYLAQTYDITVWQLLGGSDQGVNHLPVLNYSLAVAAAAVDPMQSWAEGPGLVTATVGQKAKFWVGPLFDFLSRVGQYT